MADKICFKCSRSLPLEEFYRHKEMADGHLNKCKDCAKRDVARHREENLEAVQAYDRRRGMEPHRVALREAYAKTVAGKEARDRGHRAYNARNPEKRVAHQAVNNAVRDGRMTKPEGCEMCGATGRIHGHHDDYSKPLEVCWVCPPCHRQIHQGEAA